MNPRQNANLFVLEKAVQFHHWFCDQTTILLTGTSFIACGNADWYSHSENCLLLSFKTNSCIYHITNSNIPGNLLQRNENL